jgi:hypothetical protein
MRIGMAVDGTMGRFDSAIVETREMIFTSREGEILRQWVQVTIDSPLDHAVRSLART